MSVPKAPFWWSVAGLVAMALLTGFQDALTDQKISSQEWIQVLIQLVMATNVYLAANLPGFDKAKTYVAAVIAGLQVLYTVIPGGVDLSEGINMGITILAALGVAFGPKPLTRTTVDGDYRVYRASDGPPRATLSR